MEFVLAIILITTIGGILKARYGVSSRDGRRLRRRDRDRAQLFDDHDDDYQSETADTVRLREEIKMLKERIQTLERITVDKESSLARQIDELRDR